MGVASNFMIDFYTKLAFVKKRDAATVASLKDNSFFKWLSVWRINWRKKVSRPRKLKHSTLHRVVCDYILSLSQISVQYPHSQNRTIFTIMANDEMRGFTQQELKDKVYAYYEMLLYMADMMCV
jgi:hypothetical protein